MKIYLYLRVISVTARCERLSENVRASETGSSTRPPVSMIMVPALTPVTPVTPVMRVTVRASETGGDAVSIIVNIAITILY